MHKFINNQIPSIFSDLIKTSDHKYPTNFSQSSFYSLSISIQGPKLWKDVFNKEDKDIQSDSRFQ